MSVDTTLTAESIHSLLTAFWNKVLEIEPSKSGFFFTMPISYPDGWQVVLELCQKTPRSFFLNDRGKTLSWLKRQGQNIETEAVQGHLKHLFAEHRLHEENGVLCRWLSTPLEASEIHVFAEGLAAISRLEILNEHRISEENVADSTVQRVFSDAGLEPKRHHKLSIARQRNIFVDYFVQQQRPIALQIVKTKNDLPGTMEKWGFRWRELKTAYSGLVPVMLYDRNTQMIDSYSRHIGETECELFCGYDETDRIHDLLQRNR